MAGLSGSGPSPAEPALPLREGVVPTTAVPAPQRRRSPVPLHSPRPAHPVGQRHRPPTMRQQRLLAAASGGSTGGRSGVTAAPTPPSSSVGQKAHANQHVCAWVCTVTRGENCCEANLKCGPETVGRSALCRLSCPLSCCLQVTISCIYWMVLLPEDPPG